MGQVIVAIEALAAQRDAPVAGAEGAGVGREPAADTTGASGEGPPAGGAGDVAQVEVHSQVRVSLSP